MKTKRVIISLRENEVDLIKTILQDYMHNNANTQGLDTLSAQAQKMLREGVQKIIDKLEAK